MLRYRAGKPQVILPTWLDTYDMADRTEYLGNGLWGNRKSCPHWTSQELSAVFVEVFLSPRHNDYTKKALQLSGICLEKGPGRDVAAQKILELLCKPQKD